MKQLFFVGFLFCVFLARSEAVEKTNNTKMQVNETDFSIHFQEELKVDGDMFTAIGEELLRKEKLIIRYKLKTEKEKEFISQNLKTSMTCKVTGKLEEPKSSTNENAFNYKEYLKKNEIFWVLNIEHLNLSSCSPSKKTLRSFFRTLRQKGVMYVNNYFPNESASLAVALLFGERDYIEADVIKSYQKLGIVHLLAISGLHVSMLAGMIYYLGIRLGVAREKMTTALLVFLPSYALITGAAPSVIRAVFMMMLLLVLNKGRHLFSSLLTIDLISIVFILYTFFSPLVIYDIGFQLSFGISLSLILSAPFLLKRMTNPLMFLFATSFICQLASAPILFYYFYELSLISVFANVVYVPLFSMFILPAIFILFLLHLLFGTAINLFLIPLNTLIVWMDYVTGKLAHIPFATITLGRPSLFISFLYFFSIPFFFSQWERVTEKKKIIRLFCLPLAIFLLHASSNTLSPYGEITFIDVGQGESIFIKLPHGKGNYLIDTGGTLRFHSEEWKVRQKQYEVGKDVVVPFLKSKGITTIDKLILTHGDTDHIGGSFEIIKELNVKEIILPKTEELSELERDLLILAKKRVIPFRFTKAGEGWKKGKTVFQVLSPQDGIKAERNNGSIVLFVKIGGMKWLFTGDLEVEGEEKLIKQYEKLKVDVLKVGHHGSKSSTSEKFLDKIEPKIAVISAGKNNRYGHPNREVMKHLHERNIKILRTDQYGAISYIFKGEVGTFSMQLP